uniref:Uncharacterized protein n=1 Tax=Peronospora matthiolae TaxID=2874970 RepID=A0AAV1UVM2_9STRA
MGQRHPVTSAYLTIIHCAAKASRNGAIKLSFFPADQVKAVNAAGENLPTASSGAGSRGDALLGLEDHDLKQIYSGESDGDTESTKATTKTEPSAAMTESMKSVKQRAMSLAEHRDVFKSFDSSDASSSRMIRLLKSNQGGGKS